MKNVAVIMAGGKGERFWPMSTKEYPKQFLRLTDSSLTMIQLTVERIKKLVDLEDIYIITNRKYEDIMIKQLKSIPKENIIFEPVSKNTAPCIGLASAIIKKKYGDANVIVLSSDHAISNNILFLSSLTLAINHAEKGNIITLGIVPTRIETGYGYIKLGDKLKENDSIYKVEKFYEKPSYTLAKEYYDSKEFLWNSGIFVWKNSTIYQAFKVYMPELFSSILALENSVGHKDFYDVLECEFNKLESNSIDYGIMEKAKNIMVVPGSFGWDDVGSWLSVERLRNSDENNNILEGKIIEYNSTNNIMFNQEDKKLLAVSGVENLVIINTEKSLLIIDKDKVPEIKELIKKIKEDKECERFL